MAIHVFVDGKDVDLLTWDDTVIPWEQHRKELEQAYALQRARQAIHKVREEHITHHHGQ